MTPNSLREPSADRAVRIEAYDPQWPDLYASEQAVLSEAIGSWAAGGIHHVGSTAVPGVDAEPVIDMLAGIEAAATSRCFDTLVELGYAAGAGWNADVGLFSKSSSDLRLYDLYVAPVETELYSQMLGFRDLLRANRQVAIGYVGLKRDLAERHGHDRDGYRDAKANLIRAVLAQL